ncbi:hypothetical protein SAMN02745146_3253 [Hymenobacter daecheongensis DSM 21074]|uniref:DUF1574 domain-containing protein n=1 Tax=Hymenobacter daecheongensis DSM 21074 TaxID=1121955 RepID=A0A1M6JT00_9BACT|nr:hypothetical protein [Hymenobacter daecheongensis]SHJ49762.1 hypothetical protein SAMN02745146_3253 [Hymenobacter daecheongensis DSM 21074]
MRLIVRSLLIAGLLLGGYSLLLHQLPAALVIPQGINQDNQIKMQQYVYGRPEAYSAVIVGSSLAAKLRSYALPAHTYNLAFRGQSVFEGFEILRRTGQVPKLILVEVDVLDRASDASTAATLFHPIMHPLRQALPALREQNQPLNQLFGLGFRVLERLKPAAAGRIREKVGGAALPSATAAAAEAPEAPTTAQDAALALKMEQGMRQNFAQLPDTAMFRQNVQALRTYIDYFSQRGSRVAFFEMPISAVACQSNKLNYMRQQLLTMFPRQRFTYLPQPDCQAYTTTDGMHLSDASALRYSHELNRQLTLLHSLSYAQ